MVDVPFLKRIQHAWNAFTGRSQEENFLNLGGPSYSVRPDRHRLSFGNERSIVNAVYTRIAIDVSAIPIQHVRIDQNGSFLEILQTRFNECLTVSANLDQSSSAFIQDVVISMFDEGCVAIVPTDTTFNPSETASFDILSLRTGKIVEWFPQYVRLEVYNERSGQKEIISLPKKDVAIIENPFYPVMNEPNSTLKRLIAKLNILDAIDQQSGSGKLDIIIQLPYVIKTQLRKEQAELRRKEIEEQLAGSKYGIAYTDGTERITQLNRPAENNLMKQIEYLTSMLYGQLGMTEAIINGTAGEKEMLNYQVRTVYPILNAIIDSMSRKFLTKTARTQGQAIRYFKNPFNLVPVAELASMADSFTRNAIVSSNEIRDILGMKPSKDPNADTLSNKNLNQQTPANPEES